MSTPSFTDGKLHEKEFSTWPEIDFPFEGNSGSPDIHARVFKRKFWVDPLRYISKITNRTPRGNQFLFSEDFNNAAWTKTASTITAGQYANPIDGALTAALMTGTGGTSAHGVEAAATASGSFLGNRLTVFVRYLGSQENIWLEFVDSASATDSAIFDLAAGVAMPAGTGGSTKAGSITKLPDGWFLLGMNFTSASGAGTARIYSGAGGVVSVAAGASFHIFGAQLVQLAASGIYVRTVGTARNATMPEVDGLYNTTALGADIFAFHVGESAPTYITRRRAWVQRTYARIPRQQIVPDSRFFTRPKLHDTKSGTAYAVGFFPDRDHIFTSRKTVSSLAALTASTSASATVAAPLAHDLITIKGNVYAAQSFYADDSDATILLALSQAFYNDGTHNTTVYFPILRNAGKVVIASGNTWTMHQLSCAATSTVVQMENNNALAVTSTAGELFSFSSVGNSSTTTDSIDPSIRTVAATAHGGVVGDKAAFWANDAIYALGIVLTVPDADHFTVTLDTLPGKDATVTHCGFSSDAALCVLNGPRTCSIQRITDFYLPGYTEGIATAADIPGQDPATDPVNWLTAIIAGTTWVNLDGSELKPYQGPILQREYSQVQLADAVQTVTP